MSLPELYRPSLTLLTHLYQLTMAYGYWKTGVKEKEAAFNLYFRSNPFGGGYTITCGTAYIVDYLEGLRFDEADIAYLAELRGNDGAPLFEPAFLDDLLKLTFTCDVDAMPEGTVVFPHEPLVRVTGPMLQAQVLEEYFYMA